MAVVATVACLALFNSSSIQGQSLFKNNGRYAAAFNHFINKFGKSYGTKEEYLFRLKIFIETYHDVMDHNTMNELSGYKKGLN